MDDADESEADRILEDEPAEGNRAAQVFAEHLHRMGAAMTQRAVEIDRRNYLVTVEAK